jgi:hypothetical protein
MSTAKLNPEVLYSKCNQLKLVKRAIATIDRLTDAKQVPFCYKLLGYGREIIIWVVVAWI